MSDTGISVRIHLPRKHFDVDVDIEMPSKGITAIFGQSGSGKTTLLRCIAGLEKKAVGTVTVHGRVWQSREHFLPAHRRSMGYIFQEASLFPHLSAQGNIDYAIKRARVPLSGNQYEHIIDMLGIGSLLQRNSNKLSGGEKQRVAIARALLINPMLLLMDEPLSSLDMARKQEILPYLENLKSELKLPILYVSHSPNEIARLADHLVAMDNGKVVTHGPLVETLSKIDFPLQLGEDTGVVLEGEIVELNQKWHLAKVSFAGGDLWVRDGGLPVSSAVRVRILARDISLALSHHNDSSIVNLFSVLVDDIVSDMHPAMVLVRLKIDNTRLIARITKRSVDNLNLKVGDQVWAQIKSAALVR